ncbi:MAG: sulfate adenylyltransferase subunit CysN [Thermoanaerobaculia bacterium]
MTSMGAPGIEAFLEQYRKRELLRFLTCGSVDDGKSTLIGRLLHDSFGVYDDQLSAARKATAKHGTTGEDLDLALLVDGLQAEREQGITIDVAYRYFSTPRRKFIIADTPGHEQYTRNMATGASTCDLAVILMDATRGVLDQTRRHAFIATLLGIRHLVVAVNKMDLAGYSASRFESIREDFAAFAAKLQVGDVHFIPLSALRGDNVVHASTAMPWYRGGPLLDYLETVHIASDRNLIDLRLPIQVVLRPSAEFRGYAGSIASGVLRKGDAVTVLPSGHGTRIRAIRTLDGESDEAFSPMAVTVTLEDEVDVSRGDMLVHPNNAPRVEQEFEAMIVWMHDAPAAAGRQYLLKHTTVVVPATVADIRYRINVNTLHREPCEELHLNEIGRVRLDTARLLAFDSYVRNRATGAFILIDRLTNVTVAAGMILDRDPAEVILTANRVGPDDRRTGPSPEDWWRRSRHVPVTVIIRGAAAQVRAQELRNAMFRRGLLAEIVEAVLVRQVIGTEVDDTAIARFAHYLRHLGVSAIVAVETDEPLDVRVTTVAGTELQMDGSSADAILRDLDEAGALRFPR